MEGWNALVPVTSGNEFEFAGRPRSTSSVAILTEAR
jgi:hypothetical protein